MEKKGCVLLRSVTLLVDINYFYVVDPIKTTSSDLSPKSSHPVKGELANGYDNSDFKYGYMDGFIQGGVDAIEKV